MKSRHWASLVRGVGEGAGGRRLSRRRATSPAASHSRLRADRAPLPCIDEARHGLTGCDTEGRKKAARQ
jgi:hypothetical protein